MTLMISMLSLTAWAQNYTIHKVSAGVTLESGGKTVAAETGMTLRAVDCFNIPEGGVVEVLNSSDKRIYRSVRPGKVSVSRLLIEARESATDKIATLSTKTKIGARHASSGKRVYNEKGMVNRSICEVDSLSTDTVCADKNVQEVTARQ